MPDRTLYVRRVPDALLREAKADAARRGITLGALVIEALRDKVGGARVLADDEAWFTANRDLLVERYEGQYVAIVDRTVVDHDGQLERLAQRVFARGGVRSVFMPLCSRTERVVHLRSPRVAR